jgi:hypothetical protein
MLDNHALLLADCRRAVEKSRITVRLRRQTIRSIDRAVMTSMAAITATRARLEQQPRRRPDLRGLLRF